MSGWQAANISTRSSKRLRQYDHSASSHANGDEADSSSNEDSHLNPTSTRLSAQLNSTAESAEAALVRLTESYSAAIESFRCLCKVNSRVMKNVKVSTGESSGSIPPDRNHDDVSGTMNDNDSLNVLKRAAKASRALFERTILSDPLIHPNIPTLWKVMSESRVIDWYSSYSHDREKHQNLPSAVKKATLKKLIYLSLVNYADLLTNGCSCGRSSREEKDCTSILNKGVVHCLDVLADSNVLWTEGKCLWGEKEEVTKKLALVSYCEAADLDGSDPMIWLKVACAARSLGVLQSTTDSDQNSHIPCLTPRYLRLERYAIEQGIIVLPANVPPNRCVLRAYDECCRRMSESFPRKMCHADDESKKVTMEINIPKYSWATLGRILIRACKEGGSYGKGEGTNRYERLKDSHLIGAPCLKLYLSPILALPTNVLGTICEFLADNDSDLSSDIENLEYTCRALSGAIMSARACLQQQKNSRLRKMENEMKSDNQIGSDKDIIGTHELSNLRDANPMTVPLPQHSSLRPSSEVRSSRLSDRIRSQSMLSGKQNERSEKKLCIHHSLVNVAFSCPPSDPGYVSVLRESQNTKWRKWCPFTKDMANIDDWSDDRIRDDDKCVIHSDSKVQGSQSLADVVSNCGSSSLIDFIANVNSHNSGPYDVMNRFLRYVSLNVYEVYQIDEGGRMILSSCLLDCFDFISKKYGQSYIYPSWYCEHPSRISRRQSVEDYAINLLIAELRLRRCERYDLCTSAYDDDANSVKTVLPKLIRYCEDTAQNDFSNTVRCLKIRTYWLAACFYMWIGKNSCSVSDLESADCSTLNNIDNALKLITQLRASKNLIVYTPHLIAPGRVGRHWDQLSEATLSLKRNEIALNTVLSRCRQRFQQFQLYINPSCDKVVYFDEELLSRYAPEGTMSLSKQHELTDDFVALYGDYLLSDMNNHDKSVDALTPACWELTWQLIPTTVEVKERCWEVENLSLLSIISLCVLSQHGSKERLMWLFIMTAIDCIHQHDDQTIRNQLDTKHENKIYDSDSSDDESSPVLECDGKPAGNRSLILLLAAKLFVAKLYYIVSNFVDRGTMDRFVQEGLVSKLLEAVFTRRSSTSFLPRDYELIVMVLKFLCAVRKNTSESLWYTFKDSVFLWLARFLVVERPKVEEPLLGKIKTWGSDGYSHQTIEIRAKTVSLVAAELAIIMSESVHSIGNSMLPACVSKHMSLLSVSPLVPLVDCLCSLWVTIMSRLKDNTLSRFKVSIRKALKTMLISIGSVIISLSGSVGIYRLTYAANASTAEQTFQAADYFDSDESARDLELEDEVVNDSIQKKLKCYYFHLFSMIVRCVGIVFEQCEEIDGLESIDTYVATVYGRPILPAITIRVLGLLSDCILEKFAPEGVWSEVYPFGVRSAGAHIDSLLCKGYRHLHGIHLVPLSNLQTAISKDMGCPGNSNNVTDYPPESKKAAIQLYRCIMRVYKNGRRLPPKSALECVMKSLTITGDTRCSRAINSFIFNNSEYDYFYRESEAELIHILEQPFTFDLPSDFPLWTVQCGDDETTRCLEDEEYRVRKGICELLAKGPIPRQGMSELNQSKGDFSNIAEEREQTSQTEIALFNKLEAIIDALQFSPTNHNLWFRAGLCLSIKAGIISDRLPLLKASYDGRDFFLPSFNSISANVRPSKNTPRNQKAVVPLNDLLQNQYEQFQSQKRARVEAIGDDLSFFARYSWANFHTLRSATSQLLSETSAEYIFRDMELMYQEEKYSDWQNTWGRIFVSSLQRMSKRCLHTAFVLSAQHVQIHNDQDEHIYADIAEALGTAYYNDIMGSVSDGYPSFDLTLFEKRKKAGRAILYFQQAIDLGIVSAVEEPDTPVGRARSAVWFEGRRYDLHFMIGKCLEKVAVSLYDQSFRDVSGQCSMPRVYEILMKKSLSMYNKAKIELKICLEKGVGPEVIEGGSSHGVTEILYRLHATRFKCLLRSAKCTAERELTELEALRITEDHWHNHPDDLVAYQSKEPREKVWDVFCDTVQAMIQCRKECSYFHRSVFRHAQALLWAPVFFDPQGDLSKGSLTHLPIAKSGCLWGSQGDSCAHAAAVVIASLFDKKRQQLCALWVTTPSSPTPFEVLNDANRKYDALRSKYISAYIDCLRLCNNKDTLGNFISWIDSASIDLPSYYEKSAMTKGATPIFIHSEDNILSKRSGMIVEITKYANAALADVIRQKSFDLCKVPWTDKTCEVRQEILLLAYKCFRRLNCPIDDRLWTSLYVRRILEEKKIAEVEALCHCFLFYESKNNYVQTASMRYVEIKLAVLKKALAKCALLFNARLDSQYSKKRLLKRKLSSSTITGDN